MCLTTLMLGAGLAHAVPASPDEALARLLGEARASLPAACADPAVLQNISSRFSHKEGRFWNSGLQLLAFERVQEVAWRPWGLDYIPRRYCTGTVVVSDGFKWWLISSGR